MHWFSPQDKLPPQGKKILAFYKGDCYVVQRIGECYFPIPFVECQFARIDSPDLWADIEMPEGYTGKMMLKIGDEFHDVDSASDIRPDIVHELRRTLYDLWMDRYKRVREPNTP